MGAFELGGGSSRVELAPGWALRAPGIVARGEIDVAAPGSRRAADLTGGGPLEQVFAALQLSSRATIALDVDPTSSVVTARRGGQVGASEVCELDVPPPPSGSAQLLLEIGEDGTMTWHPLHEEVTTEGRRGAGATHRYRIPLRSAPQRPAPGERRGLATGIGRHVLKVLLFPITDFALGAMEQGIARAWEKRRAPYCVRAIVPPEYSWTGGGTLTPADWKRLAGGPALLFVHGTFSSAQHCFGRLPRDTIKALSDRFGGRVFALDHWTLSHDPWENASWFVQQIPDGLSLDLDIVCHSRGGLVSRVLAGGLPQLPDAPERMRVTRLVFVAAPNDGTLLADADHMVKMLDRFTNVLQFLPEEPVEAVLESVVAAVKTLAHAGLTHLPGLTAVAPDSACIAKLRALSPGETQYYALAADWEPSDDSPFLDLVKQTVADRVMDRVFEDEKNDLVVPTSGVARASGAGFPIAASRVFEFPPTAGAMHTNLFGQEETSRRLLSWLTAR